MYTDLVKKIHHLLDLTSSVSALSFMGILFQLFTKEISALNFIGNEW